MTSAPEPIETLVEQASSRIDATKTEDMVPASELRDWLSRYIELAERVKAAERKVRARDMLLREYRDRGSK